MSISMHVTRLAENPDVFSSLVSNRVLPIVLVMLVNSGQNDHDVGNDNVGVINLGVSWVLGSWLVLGGCLTGGGTWWKNIKGLHQHFQIGDGPLKGRVKTRWMEI